MTFHANGAMPAFDESARSEDSALTGDGRHRRSRASRRRIGDAMIELVREGNPSPTAEEVARRAGTAIRTVFRHFDDMESLYREIAETIQSQARSMFDAQITGETWRERLDQLID